MKTKNNKGLTSGLDQMLSSAESHLEQSTSFTSTEQEVEVSLNIKLPQSLRTKLKTYVAQKNTSIKELLINLITNEIQ